MSVGATDQLPKIGLLNLMPSAAMAKTEGQWRTAFEDTAEVVPVKFDADPREQGCRAADHLAQYPAIGKVADALDGLIVTGANLERREDGSPLPFGEINYSSQLDEVLSWAEQDTALSIYSCLAAHIALNRLCGLQRDIAPEKVFGVYCHDLIKPSAITHGLEGVFQAPHSRWGNILTKLLSDAGVDVLIEGYEPGWLLATRARSKGLSVFIQGHPEYGPNDLRDEYDRDVEAGQTGSLPDRYVSNNEPDSAPTHSWQQGAQQIFTNIGNTLQAEKALANISA